MGPQKQLGHTHTDADGHGDANDPNGIEQINAIAQRHQQQGVERQHGGCNTKVPRLHSPVLLGIDRIRIGLPHAQWNYEWMVGRKTQKYLLAGMGFHGNCKSRVTPLQRPFVNRPRTASMLHMLDEPTLYFEIVDFQNVGICQFNDARLGNIGLVFDFKPQPNRLSHKAKAQCGSRFLTRIEFGRSGHGILHPSIWSSVSPCRNIRGELLIARCGVLHLDRRLCLRLHPYPQQNAGKEQAGNKMTGGGTMHEMQK